MKKETYEGRGAGVKPAKAAEHVHTDECGHGVPIEPIVRGAPKTGRNDPCPCGSGKKFKKCCGVAKSAS